MFDNSNGDALTNNRGAGASSPQNALDEAKRITVVRGASAKDIRSLGRWVDFQNSDIAMLKQTYQWAKIGYGRLDILYEYPLI